MRICVLAEGQMRSEFLQKGVPGEIEIIWADTVKVMYSVSDIDAYFDLLFHTDRERMSALSKIKDRPVFINAVNQTLNETGGSFIRINAWPTMLNRDITELAIHYSSQEEIIAPVFKELQWRYLIVPDIPGMITPRVIAMIVNEAYFALEQNVSTKEEIDIAMKLGTNYPMGPFEWSRKIGLGNIYSLLHELSLTNERYRPSELLRIEASGEGNVEYRV